MKVFAEKFGDAAAKFYDLSVREDRYFISEIFALDSFVAHLDEIQLFPHQFIMVNLATLDVPSILFGADFRGSITNMARDHLNTTLPSISSPHSYTLSKPVYLPSIS